ncbi:MAG: MarR family transcriptional regulator [Streptosporangiales bacterium]|nr:MarR family transcriptional regulator [Streptosporangiales bacterium]
MNDDPAELAVEFNRRLREVVLLVRQATTGLPLTAQQLSVLGSLESGPRRMSDLAAEHGVRQPTMTVQVNRLEEAGLVSRGRDADDARVVTVALTDEGCRDLAHGRRARTAFLAERFAALTPDERAAIAAALPAIGRLRAP